MSKRPSVGSTVEKQHVAPIEPVPLRPAYVQRILDKLGEELSAARAQKMRVEDQNYGAEHEHCFFKGRLRIVFPILHQVGHDRDPGDPALIGAALNNDADPRALEAAGRRVLRSTTGQLDMNSRSRPR